MTRDLEKEYELPAALRVTPERLAEIDAENARALARAQSPYASLSPAERERARAIREVRELLASLAAVERKLGKVFTSSGAESFDELRAAQVGLWRQIAEAYSSAGRFDLAARYDDRREEKARYLKIWRAVWRDDEHFCGCTKTAAGRQQAFIVADIWSVKHRETRPLVRCLGCRCLNVTTNARVLKPLLEQRAARAEARRKAGGK